MQDRASMTRFSRVPVVLALAGWALANSPAGAENKDTKPGPIASGAYETVQVDGKAAPPVAVSAMTEQGSTRCDPGELRVPAATPIDLRVENRSDQILTIGSPDLFAHGHLIRFDGPAGHAASELGFTIKPHSRARIVVRTPEAGSYPFTCAVTGDQGTPFKGTLTVASAQR